MNRYEQFPNTAVARALKELWTSDEKTMHDDQMIESERAIKIPPSGHPGHELANLLALDIDGKIIFKSYAHHNKFLSVTARKYLVHFIINIELKKALLSLSPFGTDKLQDFPISTSRFTAWSQEITGLFPSETPSVYYSPFRMVNGVRKETTGKLWDHYNYIKGVLKDEGVLVRNSKARSKQTEDKTVILNETDAANLKWLETKSTPQDELLDKWNNTFSTRRNILLKQNKTVIEYYTNFLGLRLQEGIQLIEADFKKLYPKECGAFQAKWDLIKDHLMLKLRNSKAIKDADDKALLLSLPELTRDQQVSAIFHLLPTITPPDRSGKKRKANSDDKTGQAVGKLTVQELRESFALRVPATIDVDPELEQVKNILKQTGQNCHPMPVVVGTVTNIEACYVIVNDTVYRVKDYIDAIDLTFKIFSVTNCKYPERSKMIWQLVQKGIFGIDDDNEKCTNWVKFLSAELQTVVARQTVKSESEFVIIIKNDDSDNIILP